MSAKIPRRHSPATSSIRRGEPAFGARGAAASSTAPDARMGVSAEGRARRSHADHAARYDALYVNTARVPGSRGVARRLPAARRRAARRRLRLGRRRRR